MMDGPFFSVIIPTHNRSNVLERAIKSVLKQSYKNFELIIVDDASDDNTSILLKAYASDIKIIKLEKNSGVSKARNVGAKMALGQWFCFLDSDDEWLPNKLQKQFNSIQAEPEYVLWHSEEIWYRHGVRVNPKKKYKKAGGDQFLRSLDLCVISPSTVAIRRDIFEIQGGFCEDFVVCEDYDLWLKITSLYQVGFVSEALIIKYGGHSDQLSARYFGMDYWRARAILWILENRKLDAEKYQAALNALKQKILILLRRSVL